MSFLIVLLLGQVGLDLAQVQKLSREFEGQWKGLFKILSVLLQILGVTVLQLLDLHLVFLLGLLELHIVVLIEVLILLNVSLLDLFLTLLVRKDELLVLHVELLLFELLDTVLSHFSLNVSALFLALNSMLLHSGNEVFDVLLIHFRVLAAFLGRILLLLLHDRAINQ